MKFDDDSAVNGLEVSVPKCDYLRGLRMYLCSYCSFTLLCLIILACVVEKFKEKIQLLPHNRSEFFKTDPEAYYRVNFLSLAYIDGPHQ